jgi:hypothetical protein
LVAWLLVPLVLFGVAVSRANELFVVSVRDRRVLYVRGRISPGLLGDIEDVVQRGSVQRATVRVVLRSGGIHVIARGVDELVAQRLRNTVGIHPVRRLKDAPVPARRNLGQRLGIAWLSWLLAGRPSAAHRRGVR